MATQTVHAGGAETRIPTEGELRERHLLRKYGESWMDLAVDVPTRFQSKCCGRCGVGMGNGELRRFVNIEGVRRQVHVRPCADRQYRYR